MLNQLAKSYLLGCLIAVILVGGIAIYQNAYAVTKCERDSRGNVCCWDTDKDGTFKPLSCW